MSFTLMRYKDGKPAPIKLSIWDAFKGVPPPKPRLHQCSSCNTFHTPETQSPLKEDQPKSRNDTGGKNSEKKEGSEESGFTKEEDAKILEMKSDGKTWAVIATEIGGGRHKGDISRRHKQLIAQDDEKRVESKEDDKTKEKDVKENCEKQQVDPAKMSRKERKAAKAKQDREAGLKKREEQKGNQQDSEAKAGATGDSSAGNTDAKAVTDEKPITLISTDHKPPDDKEMQNLVAKISKHFDRTGERLTIEEAQKMIEDKIT